MRLINRYLTNLVLIALVASVVNAAELPQYASETHMGVATCASSNCHAVRVVDDSSNVEKNEYPIWLLKDRHARAYKTLLTEQSKQIAQKLGLRDAATADVCLNCHADNVALAKRGSQFLITDGVGCEACHGGAETWLSRHTLDPYDLERNRNDGMYPTYAIAERAKLCVSCHVGDENKYATHRIMGAGHPRLSFELVTFGSRQPPHYQVDSDYIKRKHSGDPVRTMLIGAAVQAQALADNLSGGLVDHPQGHPDVALFDCYSCHRSMYGDQSSASSNAAKHEPGATRLNDGSFLLLQALVHPFNKALHDQLRKAVSELHAASSESVPQLMNAAARLYGLATQAEKLFEQAELAKPDIDKLLISILKLGEQGLLDDYIAAEQAIMSLNVLSGQLTLDTSLNDFIERGFEITRDDENFDPARLSAAMRAYLRAR